jgi:hypothetical protein
MRQLWSRFAKLFFGYDIEDLGDASCYNDDGEIIPWHIRMNFKKLEAFDDFGDYRQLTILSTLIHETIHGQSVQPHYRGGTIGRRESGGKACGRAGSRGTGN